MTYKQILVAVVLGLCAAAVPFAAEKWFPVMLPITDWLFVPGASLAKILFPEGTHTGSGSNAFVPIAASLNFVVYCILILIMSIVIKNRRKVRNIA